jgi:hypothetical protein
MPGKVNPVIVESLTMVVARVVGNDATIGFGQTGSFLELNVMLPVTAVALLESITLLAAAARNFADRCVSGITATARGPELVEQGLMLATALTPEIGYDAAGALAKEALKSGRTIRDLATERGIAPDRLDELLDPAANDGARPRHGRRGRVTPDHGRGKATVHCVEMAPRRTARIVGAWNSSASPSRRGSRRPVGPWRPVGVPFPDDAPQAATDRYVAVDRVDEDVATLIVAPWPVVDPRTGRLAFLPDDARTIAVVDLAALQTRVDRERGAHRGRGQLARPVRVGDVFWVGGYRTDPAEWDRVVDATRAGRYAGQGGRSSATASGAPPPADAEAYRIAGAAPLDPTPPAVEPPGEPPATPAARAGRVPGGLRRFDTGDPRHVETMARPKPLPAARLSAGNFLAESASADLVYFLCNVGDADAQLVLLPPDPVTKFRQAIVVDAGAKDKLPGLITDLIGEGVMADDGPDAPRLDRPRRCDPSPRRPRRRPRPAHRPVQRVPPDQRVLGPGLLAHDPGLPRRDGRDRPAGPHRVRPADERLPPLDRPLDRGHRPVAVVQLRNRFDTYGTDINDASVSLRIEAPATRVTRDPQGHRIVRPRSSRLVLGADAQTLSWSFVLSDFPYLAVPVSEQGRLLDIGSGVDALRADVLKVSHHGSKHGVNLELVERMAPALTLVSSVPGPGKYGFPHTVAQELIREALQATAGSNTAVTRSDDADLNLFYTADTDDGSPGRPLGTIGVTLTKGKWTMWRFGDRVDQPVDLTQGVRWT